MIAMTTELETVKRELRETFGRMRRLDAAILTLKEVPKPLTLADALETLRRSQLQGDAA